MKFVIAAFVLSLGLTGCASFVPEANPTAEDSFSWDPYDLKKDHSNRGAGTPQNNL